MQSVTSAPASVADDQSVRVKRYLTAMGFRVVCSVVAYFTDGWIRWTLVAAAIVLPYVAVVLANAVGPRFGEAVAPVAPQDPRSRAITRDESDHTPLKGRLVDDEGPAAPSGSPTGPPSRP